MGSTAGARRIKGYCRQATGGNKGASWSGSELLARGGASESKSRSSGAWKLLYARTPRSASLTKKKPGR